MVGMGKESNKKVNLAERKKNKLSKTPSASHGPSFFKIIPENINLKLCRMIPASLKKVIGERFPCAIYLRGPACELAMRVVVIRGEDGAMLMGKGWKDFISKNDVKSKDFLVFQYVGNNINFEVQVFGPCGVEKISLMPQNKPTTVTHQPLQVQVAAAGGGGGGNASDVKRKRGRPRMYEKGSSTAAASAPVAASGHVSNVKRMRGRPRIYEKGSTSGAAAPGHCSSEGDGKW